MNSMFFNDLCASTKQSLSAYLVFIDYPFVISDLIASYFDINALLFFAGTEGNKYISYFENVKYENMDELSVKDLIIIGSGAANSNHDLIRLIIRKMPTKLGSCIDWPQFIPSTFEFGDCELVKHFHDMVAWTQISVLIDNKFALIESTNGLASSIGLVELLMCPPLRNNYVRYVERILIISFKYSHVDTICQIPKLMSKIEWSWQKDMLKFLIKSCVDITSYELFIVHTKGHISSHAYNNVYTECFSDAMVTKNKNHMYAKGIIKLVGDHIIVNELNRHERKRKKLKDGIEHIVSYLREEKMIRSEQYVRENPGTKYDKEFLYRHHLRMTRR